MTSMSPINGFLAVEGRVPFEVELHAFGERGREIRIVEVPVEDAAKALAWDKTPEADAKTHGPGMLGPIFMYGQNDFQPKEIRSISVGDIIRIEGARWVICGIGFHEVPPDWMTPTVMHGRGAEAHLIAKTECEWGLGREIEARWAARKAELIAEGKLPKEPA